MLLKRAGIWSWSSTGNIPQNPICFPPECAADDGIGTVWTEVTFANFLPWQCVCVCVHRVSVLRGSRVNTEWSHTGNKLSDETLKNY